MRCILNFQWDAVKNIEGYRLYKTKQTGSYGLGEYSAIAHIPRGIEHFMLGCDLAPLSRWFFGVTAYDKLGNESFISNEVTIFVQFPQVSVATPKNLSVKYQKESM